MHELTTKEALSLIGVPHAELRSIYALPKRKATRAGRGRRAWLFSAAHVRRVALMVSVAGLTLPAACRVVAAESQGRL